MSYMNFIMIGLQVLREALDRLRVRLNMYLVYWNVDVDQIHSCTDAKRI